MKKQLLWLLTAASFAAQAATAPPVTPPLAPQPQYGQAARLAAQILTRYHYRAMPLDNAMSEKIFDRYLKDLDPEKVFFVQADVNQFSFARSRLDDAINLQNLQTPFDIFNRYEQRVIERLTYARSLLKQGFDFNVQESFEYDRHNATWPASDDEVRDLWRKRVKNDWLRLKLTGKKDAAIRETLDKRYSEFLRRVRQYNGDDAFQIFMNAYANSLDPHTDYFAPRRSEDFDIAMSLSVTGIGAVLQTKEEYTTINELVPGGPAALSGRLHAGDKIVGVGQGKDGAITDVVGWRVDDVVALIRGAVGSTLRLAVQPAAAGPDAKPVNITLVRSKITLETQAAKKSIITVKDGSTTQRIGVITLPSFYEDFDALRQGDKNYKSASRDVSRLLQSLKQDKVDGVLVDLRNNGGGSLTEAVDLVGLFTGHAPVVQERDARGDVKVERADEDAPEWNGPLGVLINRGSASASEIFAAAIQDLGRGVIIGEPSFGKGTVQALRSLDQIVHNDKPVLGELKMTIAQFFRINGGTTQLRGVTPDIGFPPISDLQHFGESSYDNALPWTQVKPADYVPERDVRALLPQLSIRHDTRVAKDNGFQALIERVALVEAQRKKTVISLNEAERRKERDTMEARLKALAKRAGKAPAASASASASAKAGDKNASAETDPLLGDDDDGGDSLLGTDTGKKHDKDAWLDEAAHIVGDEASLLRGGHKLLTETGSRSPAVATVRR